MLASAAAFTCLAGPSLAATASGAMAENELEGERAGLLTPSGLEIGFGATVRTLVDGKVVLETRMDWTEHGPVRQVLVGGGPGAGSTAAMPGDGDRVSIPGVGGATAVTHQLDASRIANVVVNTASDRSVLQQTNLDLILPRFDQMQQDFAQARMAVRLQDSISRALVGAGLK